MVIKQIKGMSFLLKSSAVILSILSLIAITGQVKAGSDYGDFAENVPAKAESLVVGGGCFWCIEKDFETLDAIYEVVSGYAGGDKLNPTYQSHPGHREVVKIYYDPDAITFDQLISHYYALVDYEDNEGQFCDRGRAYTPVIHVKNDTQRQIAERLAPATSVVPVEGEVKFWSAEKYHQDYYLKNKLRYKFYRSSCGRDRRVSQLNNG
ncbi:MAG: peptide-methionine (S)-S-oxide reductase [Candidatus Puniceispirillaceae bacterium]